MTGSPNDGNRLITASTAPPPLTYDAQVEDRDLTDPRMHARFPVVAGEFVFANPRPGQSLSAWSP
jgi:hypothetical protein